jgi:hypothetical protein
MTNQEAYGNRSYEQRLGTLYQVGDFVSVGPAYQMVGTYAIDGFEGQYEITARHEFGNGMNDYEAVGFNNSRILTSVSASRFTLLIPA